MPSALASLCAVATMAMPTAAHAQDTGDDLGPRLERACLRIPNLEIRTEQPHRAPQRRRNRTRIARVAAGPDRQGRGRRSRATRHRAGEPARGAHPDARGARAAPGEAAGAEAEVHRPRGPSVSIAPRRFGESRHRRGVHRVGRRGMRIRRTGSRAIGPGGRHVDAETSTIGAAGDTSTTDAATPDGSTSSPPIATSETSTTSDASTPPDTTASSDVGRARTVTAVGRNPV